LPITAAVREYAEAGSLMSYGSNLADMFRQVGIHASSIVKVPSLPTFRFCSRANLNCSSTRRPRERLGLEVPPMLFACANEVIE
jgi:hypothetical protein